MLPLTVCAGGSRMTAADMTRSTSAIANMPTMAGISSTPDSMAVKPKVKRGRPAGFSTPISATPSPMNRASMPFTRSAWAMNTAQVSPRQTSQKYSKELNRIATSASAGADVASTSVPKTPPIAEKTTPAPSASSAWPFMVIA
jgi:hypothetical protein